jgi:hypothetical protein
VARNLFESANEPTLPDPGLAPDDPAAAVTPLAFRQGVAQLPKFATSPDEGEFAEPLAEHRDIDTTLSPTTLTFGGPQVTDPPASTGRGGFIGRCRHRPVGVPGSRGAHVRTALKTSLLDLPAGASMRRRTADGNETDPMDTFEDSRSVDPELLSLHQLPRSWRSSCRSGRPARAMPGPRSRTRFGIGERRGWVLSIATAALIAVVVTGAISVSPVAWAKTQGGGGGGGPPTNALCFNQIYSITEYQSVSGTGLIGSGPGGYGLNWNTPLCSSGAAPGFSLSGFGNFADSGYTSGPTGIVPSPGPGSADYISYGGAGGGSFEFPSTASAGTYEVLLGLDITGAGIEASLTGDCYGGGTASGYVDIGFGVMLTDDSKYSVQSGTSWPFYSGTASCSQSSGTYQSATGLGYTFNGTLSFAFSFLPGSTYTMDAFVACNVEASNTGNSMQTNNIDSCVFPASGSYVDISSLAYEY